MLNDPKKVVNLLAASVPTQVKSFIRFVLVNLFVVCSFKLLPVVRIGLVWESLDRVSNLIFQEKNATLVYLESR